MPRHARRPHALWLTLLSTAAMWMAFTLQGCLQCADNGTQRGSRCVRLCNSTADCGTGFVCENGECAAGGTDDPNAHSPSSVTSSASSGATAASSTTSPLPS